MTRMTQRLRRWATAYVVALVAVILWGAFVRATGSGAGCGSHWPLCNGEVVPPSPTFATVVEWTHRATSGLAGLLGLAVLGLAWRARRRAPAAWWSAMVAFGFLLVEAWIGMLLVRLELVGTNASPARGWAMAGHLVNTLLLLAAATATAWWAGPWRPARPALRPALATLALLGFYVLVAAAGAIAALGDTLFPARSLAHGLAQDVDPSAPLLLRLRLLHPPLAIAAAALTLLWAARLPRWRPHPLARRLAFLTGVGALVQVAVGAVNVTLLAPVPLQILHLALADALWIALVLSGLFLASRPCLDGGDRGVPGDVRYGAERIDQGIHAEQQA